jgi:peptidoglycan hydrolase-like protein with peptidoglycan-binding domain
MQLAKDLFFGMSNDEVLLLQKFLIAKGYLSADLNTGYFGTATYNAVRSYQRAGGISSTGIVGPLTRAKINGELSGMDL